MGEALRGIISDFRPQLDVITRAVALEIPGICRCWHNTEACVDLYSSTHVHLARVRVVGSCCVESVVVDMLSSPENDCLKAAFEKYITGVPLQFRDPFDSLPKPQ